MADDLYNGPVTLRWTQEMDFDSMRDAGVYLVSIISLGAVVRTATVAHPDGSLASIEINSDDFKGAVEQARQVANERGTAD